MRHEIPAGLKVKVAMTLKGVTTLWDAEVLAHMDGLVHVNLDGEAVSVEPSQIVIDGVRWGEDRKHRSESDLDEIADRLDQIEREEREILERLPPLAKSATLKFVTSQGETTMPLTVHVNDKPGTAVYQEFDGPNGTGNKVPPTGKVAYASDSPTVATVDPVTGQLAYLAAGQATISASDGGNLPASDVLTVTAAAAASATLTLNPGV